jgi:hypothetical protein
MQTHFKIHCLFESFVLNPNLVHFMEFSGKNRHLRQAQKREFTLN